MFRVGSLGRDDEEEEEVAPGAITCSDTMKKYYAQNTFFVYTRTREVQAYIQLLRSAKSLSVMARQIVLFMTTYIKE